jgi:altronate dehydratase small subunit
MTDLRLLLLDPSDNVYVAIQTLEAGEVLLVAGERIIVPQRLTLGHKLAARAIRAGEKIIKYRAAIGSATRDIAPGEHVHLYNMKSDYLPTYTLESGRTFSNRHDSH